jgi:hypothetical protein
MNNELFRPRGLYCLVVAHSNRAEERVTQENIAASVGSRIESKSDTMGDRFKTTFRNSDGKYGPVEFPVSAELVFPGLDAATGANNQSSSKSGFSRVLEKYGAHRDRKRTAKWVSFVTFIRLLEHFAMILIQF